MKAFLRGLFLENLGLKLVALALSGMLFLYVQGERKRDSLGGALVRLVLVPPRGKVLTNEVVEKLTLQVRGARSEVERLVSEGIPPLEIDLEGRAPGPLRFSPDLFRLSGRLSIESITPPEVDVTWDDFAMRTVPLRPSIAGQPASGYRVVSVAVEPREVEVRGPRSALDRLQEVVLDEARIDGRTEDATITARVRLKEKYLLARPDTAIVIARVQAETVTRRFSGISLRLRNPPADLEIEVAPPVAQEVLLEGPANAMKKVEPDKLRAVIELGDLREPREAPYIKTARVEGLPAGVRALATTPGTFRVRARRRL